MPKKKVTNTNKNELQSENGRHKATRRKYSEISDDYQPSGEESKDETLSSLMLSEDTISSQLEQFAYKNKRVKKNPEISKPKPKTKKDSAAKDEVIDLKKLTEKKPRAFKNTDKDSTPKPKSRGNSSNKKTRSTSEKKNSSSAKSQKKKTEEEENLFVDESIGNPDVTFKLPSFLEPENIMDKNKRRPGESGYDPTSLYIPEEKYKSFKPFLKQYWDAKMIHFDKLIGHNMSDHYWFYYNDAVVVQKLLDVRVGTLSDGRFYACIWQKSFHEMAPILLNHGYKIVLVERVSDRMEVFEKKQTWSKNRNDELVRREICQVLTRGTYFDNLSISYTARYTLCMFEYQLNFGLVFVDTTTHEFHIGEFKDDEQRSHFRTLLTRTKPLEVVYYNEYISEESLAMISNLSTKPTRSPLSIIKPRAFDVIFAFLKRDIKEMPVLLQNMMTSVKNDLNGPKYKNETSIKYFFTFQALGLCHEYMEDILLLNTVFLMGNFVGFDKSFERGGSLYLDSQALENLEILEVGYLNVLSESCSLLGYMDKTVSPFGKRMLKRWVMAPLLEPHEVQLRTEAVDDLMLNKKFVEVFQEGLSKLPDIERMVNRIYNLTDRQRMQALHYEDYALNRMKEFVSFLGDLKKVEDLMEDIQTYLPDFYSLRLRQLCGLKDIDMKNPKGKKKNDMAIENVGEFPKIKSVVEDLENMVQNVDGQIIPKPGLSVGIDKIMEQSNALKSRLNEIIEEQRKKFKSNEIVFVNSRTRFEMEFPEELVEGNKRPNNFIPTSKRKGFLRFHTKEIEQIVEKFIPLDFEFQREITPFVIEYFKKFYERNNYWRQIISFLSEIDCLCSLAKLAQTFQVKCKPVITPMSAPMKFELKNMIHPMAAKNNPNFVPNSINVSRPIFLITGTNMGGKSTLLRTACIAVIMAQIGSYVPAESFEFRAIDRIFTRIGAGDRLVEGKSTFFVEMEETYHITTQATANSLLIIDELGRGTSTYDGVSIAYATLKYIAEKINCITLFATHYHLLLEEFELYKNITRYYMQSEYDEKKDEVKFLYKFVEGRADKSCGIVIGKMAGLPDDVIKSAKKKEKFMTSEKRNIGFEKNLMEKFNKVIEELTTIENKSSLTSAADILLELSHII